MGFARMTDQEARAFYLRLPRNPAPEPEVAQELWQYACQHAFEGLDVGDREFVRAIAFFRISPSFAMGESWDHGPLGSRYDRLCGRATVLHIAYNALYCMADQGRISVCPWEKRDPCNLHWRWRYKDRVGQLAKPGLSRWLGRDLVRVGSGYPDGHQFVWKNSVGIQPGPGFLTVIVRRGLHRPPPASEIFPVSAGQPRDAGGGVWFAEGTWLTKKHYDRPPTRGWLAWSYVPGPSGDVEFLFRGPTAAGALKRFWSSYEAAQDVFVGHARTPADRHLAWSPPEEPELDLSDEDTEALAGIEAW